MVLNLARFLQHLRQSRRISSATVLFLILFALLGNAATFYIFDHPSNPEITVGDALWYSIISVTTIGYGDLSASSTGARIGTVFFIVLIGMSAFSVLLGFIMEAMVQLNYKEMHGLAKIHSKDHILIINFPDGARVQQIIDELRSDPQFEKKDIVLVNEVLDALPFESKNLFFVKGSPLELATLERAGLGKASMAIVLAPGSDSSSDGMVAAVINMIEHVQPEIKTVAECLDRRHSILFDSTACDSVVYSNQIVNNLLVQETQDQGIASLVSFLTSTTDEHNLYSCRVTAKSDSSYAEIAKRLIDQSWRLLAVVRDGKNHLDIARLKPEKGDLTIYIGNARKTWPELVKA